MRSKFCNWCIQLQKIATKENIIVEARHFDMLDYFYKTGTTPEKTYPEYKEFRKRWMELNDSSKKIISSK